jgi:integrase
MPRSPIPSGHSPARNAVAPSKTFWESLLIARKEVGLSWVGFHDLRHYFISMAGIDFMTIAELIARQDGRVLIGKVYGHLFDGHKRNMAAQLEPVMDFLEN